MASSRDADTFQRTEAMTSQDYEYPGLLAAQILDPEADRDPLFNPTSPLEGDVEFLQIHPTGRDSTEAFDALIRAKHEHKLNRHHAQYIHEKEAETPTITTYNEEGTAMKKPGPHLFRGYYSLGWHLPATHGPDRFHMGRGASRYGDLREIDIMLAPPADPHSNFIGPTHAVLRMNADGAWILEAHGEMNIDGKDYQNGEGVFLSRPKTLVIINNMFFNFIFTITTKEQEREYIERRNEALRAWAPEKPLPDTDVSGIPFESDVRFPSAVFRSPYGSGSFGKVFEGFSLPDGILVVVKRQQVKDEIDRETLDLEMKALMDLKGCMGVVTMLDVRDQNGWDGIPQPGDNEVYFILEKGMPFDRLYEPFEDNKWQERAGQLYHWLAGLAEMHDRGMMHRDITPQNLLIWPINEDRDQPRAALNDFGKVCYSRDSDDVRIAAECYLPPEIDIKRKENPYKQSLDIWMLGLACLLMWYPSVRMNRNPRRFDQYEMIMLDLELDKRSYISNFIRGMMIWPAEKRPSAAQILSSRQLRAMLAPGTLKHLEAQRLRNVSGGQNSR